MDGFTSAGVAGILYAEDFGDPAPLPPMPEPEPFRSPVLTQADVDAACIRAVAAAGRAWAEGAQERRALALEALAAGLDQVRDTAASQAEAVAEGVARAMLGMTAAVLPSLCRAHGDAEVRALLRRVLPMVANTGSVVVRAQAGVLDDIAADIAGLDDAVGGTVELRAANLPPGDVRLSWEDGGLVRDTASIQAAVRDCLSQLGLSDPDFVPVAAFLAEPRSLAHAH